MQLRTYKGLIRIILFLVSIQFFSLATPPGDGTTAFSNKHFKAEHSKSFSLSVFFEENKTEKEGEWESAKDRLLHFVEIADLSFVSELLIKIHTPRIAFIPIEQQFDLKPPLFKLHGIYII